MDNVTAFPTSMQSQSPARADVHRQLDRSGVAVSIAQMLLALQCREDGVRPVRLTDLTPKESARFRQAGELIVQMILHPDLERTAVMAAADIFSRGEYEGVDQLSIVHDQSRKRAAFMFELTHAAIRAYRETLVFESEDPDLDRVYDDFLQGLESDGLVVRR